MNDRKLTALTAIAGVLAADEFGSAVIIGLGQDPSGAGFAVLFGMLFLLAAWLVRRGRNTGGAVLSVCCACSRSPSSLAGTSTARWTGVYQSVFAAVSLAGLIAVIAVLASRLRRKAP